MSSLFLTVLNMSVKAGFAAAAVMAARFFLKNFPKIFSYALWAVVLFRLLCPFSFESALSLIPVNSSPIPKNIVYTEKPVIENSIETSDYSLNYSAESSLPPANQAANVNPVDIITEICSVIWLTGMILILSCGAFTYLKLRHNLSDAVLVRDNIYQSDRITTAFVMGIIKPRVLIPVNLTENELTLIIRHEHVHIKRLDYLIKPTAFAALAIHWFNPVIWLSYRMMSKDMEMSCDEIVMENTAEDIRADYSSSLLSISAKQSGILSPLAFGEGNLESRIKNVLNYRKPSFWAMIAATLILIFVLISFGTDSKSDDINEPYVFSGKTSAKAGNSYFLSEDIPESKQEELVFLDFLYTIERSFDRKYEILADTETHRISIENEKKNTDPEVYTSYVLHSLSTIDKKYTDIEKIKNQYDITDFEIINVVYTQKHSEKLLSLGPQWGDGTYSRNFVVGKSKSDKSYKIYDFLMPEETTDNEAINSSVISSKIHMYSYENQILKSEREIIDARSKVNIELVMSERSGNIKKSERDIPTEPYYIKIDIDEEGETGVRDTYFVYEINSKYFAEKPNEFINEITYDSYRDMINLCRLGAVPDPVFISARISKLSDGEYESTGTDGIEDPQKDDFRKLEFTLYIEFPDGITDRKVIIPDLYKLNDKSGANRYWYGNSSAQDNQGEPFAVYEHEIVMYTRGLEDNNLRELFGSKKANISWTDRNGTFNEYSYDIGDIAVFEESDDNTDVLDVEGFFENLISHDTFDLISDNNTIKLDKIFGRYCNERGLGILFKNRVVLKNYRYIEDNNIVSFENLDVELLGESTEDETVFQDYRIAYTYMDKDGGRYVLEDYYRLNIKNNKIDYIKLDELKSTVKN